MKLKKVRRKSRSHSKLLLFQQKTPKKILKKSLKRTDFSIESKSFPILTTF